MMHLADVHVQKNIMQQNAKVSMFDNVIPSIEAGCVYNLVTTKIINPYTMVLSALKHGTIDELIIATYAINQKATEIFTNLLEAGDIKDWSLLVNENMHYRMKGKEVFLLQKEKELPNFHLYKKRVHAKVTLIAVADKRIVISGSGNYSENPKIEQYTICDDKDLFEFHKSWITDRSL